MIPKISRLLSVSLFCFLFVNSLAAQYKLGIGGGANYSRARYTIENAADEAFVTNYYIELMNRFTFTERISVNADLQYSVKGYKDNFNVPDTYRFSYFDMIFELDYKVFKFLALSAGINYALTLDAERKNGEEGEYISYYDLQSIGGNGVYGLERSDYGLVAGAKIFLGNFYISARYNYGIKDINSLDYSDSSGNPIENYKLHNRNLQLGAGYLISFGGE